MHAYGGAKTGMAQALQSIASEGWLPLAAAMVGTSDKPPLWTDLGLRPVVGPTLDIKLEQCPLARREVALLLSCWKRWDTKSVADSAINTWLKGANPEFGPDCEDSPCYGIRKMNVLEVMRLFGECGFDFFFFQAIAVEQVRDASGKWLTDYPMKKRNEIEQLAVRFLLTMNSTLCFFTVAMRMLSKAPWTESMASVDVRQFALVAISRGWYVKQLASTKHSFTRAELALAAGVYEGLITPTLPDDTTVALRTIIDHLPEACNLMFSKAEVTCPFCHARSNSVVTNPL